MKKELLFLCLAFIVIDLNSQSLIPNSSFELWTTSTITYPEHYKYTSNTYNFEDNMPATVTKYSPAYHGQFAVKMEGITYMPGFISNTNTEDSDSDGWLHGSPYTEIPSGIRGYYQYNVENADSALILITFRKNQNKIADYTFKIGGIKTEYTLFDFDFEPALTQNPDSVIIIFVSSDVYKNENGIPGSTLILDSVSFTGVVNQPSEMNGDFEDWTTEQMPLIIDDWNKRNKLGEGIERTTDSKLGNYAVELTSFIQEQRDEHDQTVFRNRPGYLTTGWWDNKNNYEVGGSPFENTIDTLVFWYKYISSSTDRAQVYLHFIKNEVRIYGTGKDLEASADYKMVEIPFHLNTKPSSVIINIVSSLWDNAAHEFAGSKLIVDDMYFKSEIADTRLDKLENGTKIIFSPNPSSGILHMNMPELIGASIQINDITGKTIQTINAITETLDISHLSNGIYFIKINAENFRYNQKILKQ